MNETEYMSSKAVIEFRDWISAIVLGGDQRFSHSYRSEGRGRSTIQKEWTFNSLLDAYDQYDWPFSFLDARDSCTVRGSSFADSRRVLEELQSSLRLAVEERDNDKCYTICVMILDWGKVLGSSKKGNKKKLDSLKPYLSHYLAAVRAFFDGGDATLARRYVVQGEGLGGHVPIEMNAGFTKIYSLLCEDFIIYDGRVGAALGYLARLFMVERRAGERLPSEIQFRYGNAKNTNVNRNPSGDGYRFSTLSSPATHIRDNLKANWILKSVAGRNPHVFGQDQNPLRCLEAALFMIGYRI